MRAQKRRLALSPSVGTISFICDVSRAGTYNGRGFSTTNTTVTISGAGNATASGADAVKQGQ